MIVQEILEIDVSMTMNGQSVLEVTQHEEELRSLAAKALLGFGKLDISQGIGKVMHPGQWNPRTVNEEEAQKLFQVFRRQGLLKATYPLMIAVRRIDILNGITLREEDISTLGPLDLKEGCEAYLIGGQHRRSAVAYYRE